MDDLSTNPSHITNGKLQNGSKRDAEFPAVITNGCSQEPQQSYVEDGKTPCRRQEDRQFSPVAVCGMACRLPGGISSPPELWDFLMAKQDARTRVPPTRFNIDAYHTTVKKPGMTVAEHGYFLDETNDLGALDTSFFSMPKVEVERLDPQQRLLLEVSREALEDAGEVNWRGRDIGAYVGSFAQDWYDLTFSEPQRYGMYQVSGTHDFMLANRLSYELDLHGPSVTVRTACSAGLTGLNEACLAIARGDCESALVCGSNLVMSPTTILAESEQGVLNAEASCNTFSANANGYTRGEAIVSVFIKPLSVAERDGSPIRAVISGAAVNCDGKTHGITQPSSDAQEALIRRAYQVAGLSMFSRTGFVECHGTGTKVGDPIEMEAVGRVFGTRPTPTYIGSVKANLGHSEGASGLTSLLKVILALENRTIPPQIKAWPLNPEIPFARDGLVVPSEPTPWPTGCDELVSINSFGVGGSNAHVIVESAAAYNVSREETAPRRSTADENAPQLLLFSANKPDSLKRMTAQYQQFLEQPDISIPDVAYTLAMRREHLPFRSFSVASRSKPGTPALPRSGKPDQNPYLVMMFTGQGAQWPQMGRQLMRSNPSFQHAIRGLDKHLQDIMGAGSPGWKIEAELLKPPRTSRVNEAEFSQTLCTAIQIALVDSFAAVDIEPAAVVGHSSGEIAAAYASGMLTARDGIAIAFLRGAAATLQTKKGSMAAVGLGWDEVANYLVPGVVLACDNSPRSVTISGDAEPLQEVVAAITHAQPDIPVTVLKVDKAYHSHHMVEFGERYFQTMLECNITTTAPSKLFFSSVLGHLFQPGKDTTQGLGPKYWRKNLESPVLFREALLDLLKHPTSTNPIFLEIGPHSALAGPLRQTLTEAGSQAPYVTALTRRSNSVEDFLSAVGQLYTLHVDMDLTSLVQGGSCVADMPRYPWDHSHSYWHETRVTKERRLRQYPYHDLLGAKVAESTDLEPIWRNVFHLDNAPWVRDHKVNGTIVFPFAGYVDMAAEAIRQITGFQEGVSLRQVSVNAALLVPESSPLELVTALRPHRLTESTDSQWWEFTISSHNGHTWTKHCTGQCASTDDSLHIRNENLSFDLSRKVDAKKTYEASRRGGLDYGPTFRVFEHAMTSTSSPHRGAAFFQNRWGNENSVYRPHPIVLDAFFQLLTITAVDGLAHEGHKFVPTKVGSIIMTRPSADAFAVLTVADDVEKGIVGSGNVLDDASHTPVITLSDVHLDHLSADEKQKEQVQITARSEWVPHIDFQPVHALFEPVNEPSTATLEPALDEIVDIAAELSLRSLGDARPQSSYMEHYGKLLLNMSSQTLKSQDEATLKDQMSSMARSVGEPSGVRVVQAINSVCENTKALMLGELTASDLPGWDDSLATIHELLRGFDCSKFLATLAHTKPNLRVLELDASGSATPAHLRQLRREDGQALYSCYMATSSSTQAVTKLQDQFKGTTNFEATLFNTSLDPSSQGLADRHFDLIIASEIHRSPTLEHSLANIRKLLAPDGQLLLQTPRPGRKWLQYVLGTQAWWWCGVNDGRLNEPLVSEERWASLLNTAGFQSAPTLIPDSCGHPSFSSVIVARPQQSSAPEKQVALICNEKLDGSSDFAAQLEAGGFTVSYRSVTESPPEARGDIIFLEQAAPFFNEMDACLFEWIKALAEEASRTGVGLFWVTKESSVACAQPEFGSVVGLARALRQEMSVDFAVCEVDDMEQSAGLVLQAFTKFHDRQREANTEMGPDFEYSIHDKVTRVHRIFPFQMDPDVAHTGQDEEAVLRIGRPGRLETLHWSATLAPSLQAKEVEIEVHATGLNFRDVLLAMGLVQGPQSSFGLEIAGIVRRTGTDVTSVRVGDRVVATCRHGFATVDVVIEETCEKLPDELSFRDAVSMPVAFTTAIYSLIEIGNLSKGQSILIHSGAGGVGLAAIQVAKMIGAEIYTTVSSEDKVRYLVETFGIARNRIFNSRNASFADDLLRETGGRGADLVLNSLGGELLHTTWRRCVAKWGTMVEIGKRDLIEVGKLDMDVFLANRSYRCVDMFEMGIERPDITKRSLRAMMDYYRQGLIKPIRLAEVVKAADVIESFRYMQRGQHIGKVVIEIRDDEGCPQIGDFKSMPVKKATSLNVDGSYLIVGGLGGLGKAVSVWLAQHGARHLAFLSRSAGHGEHDQEFSREIESMGCSVQFIRGSVLDLGDVEQAISKAKSRGPLKGVIQMSMVLRDQAFRSMTFEEWETARRPKIQGTWNLHHASVASKADLDFFLLFSSVSGVLGQPGQANYASANSFLDAFVQYRKGMGLPCTAIDLGAVEDAGYLTENQDLLRKMQGMGWRPVREVELLEAMDLALSPSASITPNPDGIIADKNRFLLGIAPSVPLSSPMASTRLRRDIRLSVYHNDRKTDTGGDSKSGGSALASFLARARADPKTVLGRDAEQAANLLAFEIGERLLALLLRSDEEVVISKSLTELGLDSLVAIELRAWWKGALGFDVTVLEILGMGTLEALGRKAVERLRALYE